MTRPEPPIETDDAPAKPAQFPGDAWELLSPLLTPTRRARLAAVAAARTRHVRLVVQDIHQPHNVSACLRSADAFGVQEVDVVTLRERFKASTVAKGVSHWLTVNRHHDVAACAAALRQGGYRIYAGVPLPGAKPLGELPVDRRIAVVFGNEHDGIDPAWHQHIDQPFTIPMAGMVESLNISVCAAITLQSLTERARAAVPAADFLLPEAERRQVLNAWVCRQFNSWPELLQRLRAEREKG